MVEKIKEFLRRLFKINNCKYIEEPREEINSSTSEELYKSNNLKEYIAINNTEEKRALQLQNAFRDGKIKEHDLSYEDYMLLSDLYEKQIEKTKQLIQKYLNSIASMKKELSTNEDY